MSVEVKLRYLRVAPRKARMVADLIRGKTVREAEDQLRFTTKKPAKHFEKLLRSGVATAEHDFGFRKPNLKISEVRVDEGPTLKRVRARAQGAFHPINKRSSHLVLGLEQIEKREPRETRKKKPEKEVAEVSEEKEGRGGKPLKKAPKGPTMKEKKRKKKGIFRRKAF